MAEDLTPTAPKNNAEKFMELLGKPMPTPMTAAERAEYDAWVAGAAADADRIYGSRQAA